MQRLTEVLTPRDSALSAIKSGYFGETLLRSGKRHDSIRLDLPWGEARNFSVPAADPFNPMFQISSEAERSVRDFISEGAARGVSFARIGFDGDENAITIDKINYEAVYR